MDISILIVNYKSWNALENCLQSILNFSNSLFSFEVIVVDNCSNDGKLKSFKTKFNSFKFIENTENNGFANGCNVGAKNASGNYFLFLNPDTIANEQAVFEMFELTKNNSNYGIVSCSQVNENGKLYKEIRFFPSLKRLFGSFRALDNLFIGHKINSDFSSDKEVIFPDWATGAVIFMSKQWYEKVNGWNENYWLYFEDVAICKAVANKNGKVALTRKETILHIHGGASRINVLTKALTKAEVLISQHVYFDENTKGFQRFLIQFLFVANVLIFKSILAFISLFIFFIPKMKVHIYIFKNIVSYYILALKNRTWVSKRAPNYVKY